MPNLSAKSQGRTIAIGDVHGCADALASVVGLLELSRDDTLVMLGDVVDRGPDTRDAIELLLELQTRVQLVCLLGNHEQMMLEALDGDLALQEWLRHGGGEALDSYGKGRGPDAVDPRHVEFIRTWGDVHETPGFFFCHGGYAERMPLDHQHWDDLRWQSLNWCTPGPHASGKTAIVGHTSNKEGRIVNLGHLVCIDTYCYGGGWLTALEPDTGQVWQANEAGETRTTMLLAPRR